MPAPIDLTQAIKNREPEGEPDEQLYKYACSLKHKGLHRQEAEDLVLARARACKPPFPEAEALKKVESAWKYEPSEQVTKLDSHKLPPMPKTFTASELEGRQFKEPEWIVDGVVPEGASILASRPKVGKSFMMANVAIACACGGRALGFIPVKKRGVLYAALEDRPIRLQNRMAALYRTDCWPENLHFVTEWPRIDEGGIPLLQKWLEDHRDVSLVIIDTLAKVKPKKASNSQLYDQDYQTISAFKSLADMMEISIVLVHHVRKMDAEDPLDCLSGTTGLIGAADTGLILQRKSGNVVLYVRGRDVEEKELALRREPSGDWTLLGDAEEAMMSEERAAILKVFQDQAEAVSIKFVCSVTGKKKQNAYHHITKLAESGFVKRVKEGMYIALPTLRTDCALRTLPTLPDGPMDKEPSR